MISRGIHQLAEALRQTGRHITIETAGTVLPEGISCDLASISPKLKNSNPGHRVSDRWRRRHEELRWQPEVVRAWLSRYDFQLKFVIASPNDLVEVQLRLRQLLQLGVQVPPGKVLLMPEGTSAAVLQARAQPLIEICKREGYRFCSRLHVELFGHQRGT